MSSLAYLPIKTPIFVILGLCHCTALESSAMQDQKSLTLRRHSFF